MVVLRMPPGGSCVAHDCSSRSHRKSRDQIAFELTERITFHVFPKHPVVREAWVKALNRKGFTPTSSSTLCSRHFAESCFKTKGPLRVLKEGSVPTIFPVVHPDDFNFKFRRLDQRVHIHKSEENKRSTNKDAENADEDYETADEVCCADYLSVVLDTQTDPPASMNLPKSPYHINVHVYKSEKNAEVDEKNAEVDEKNAEVDEKNAEEDEKNAEEDEKNAEVDEKNAEEDEKNAEEDEKNAEVDKKNAEEDEKNAEVDEKNAEEDEKNADVDKKNAEKDVKNGDSEPQPGPSV